MAESKEVRKDEDSPPVVPSDVPVTVVAPQPQPPVIETIPPAVSESVVGSIPDDAAVSSPITENIPEHSEPVVQTISEALSVQTTVESELAQLVTPPSETDAPTDNNSLPPPPESPLPPPAPKESLPPPPESPLPPAPESPVPAAETPEPTGVEPASQPSLPPPEVIEACVLPPAKLVEVAAAEPSSPAVTDQVVTDLSNGVSEPASQETPVPSEAIVNADSLPDVSTESLPSLPDPVSESLPEPLSLPPVDCIPEPISGNSPVAGGEHDLLLPSPPPPASPKEAVVPEVSPSSPNGEVVLTNGNTNGLPSPTTDTEITLASVERPLKQVNSAIMESILPFD